MHAVGGPTTDSRTKIIKRKKHTKGLKLRTPAGFHKCFRRGSGLIVLLKRDFQEGKLIDDFYFCRWAGEGLRSDARKRKRPPAWGAVLIYEYRGPGGTIDLILFVSQSRTLRGCVLGCRTSWCQIACQTIPRLRSQVSCQTISHSSILPCLISEYPSRQNLPSRAVVPHPRIGKSTRHDDPAHRFRAVQLQRPFPIRQGPQIEHSLL